MNNRIEKWDATGLLVITPAERKEMVADLLELTSGYMVANINKLDESSNGLVSGLLLPIYCRIGNVVDVSVTMFFEIMDEIINDLPHISKIYADEDEEFKINGVDVLLAYVSSYCDNKIEQIKSKQI